MENAGAAAAAVVCGGGLLRVSGRLRGRARAAWDFIEGCGWSGLEVLGDYALARRVVRECQRGPRFARGI